MEEEEGRRITRRRTTLLVSEIALPRLSMGEGMRGIHRGFITEETGDP